MRDNGTLYAVEGIYTYVVVLHSTVAVIQVVHRLILLFFSVQKKVFAYLIMCIHFLLEPKWYAYKTSNVLSKKNTLTLVYVIKHLANITISFTHLAVIVGLHI